MKSFINKKRTKILIGLNVAICFLSVLLASYISYHYEQSKEVVTEDVETLVYYSSTTNEVDETTNLPKDLYLSEMDPIQKSYSYRDFTRDKDMNGNLITLKVENNLFSFKKGIFAHAKMTLVYDLTSYNDFYKYFVAFIGLNNTAASSSNGVVYHFYTSNDQKNWEEIGDGILKKPGENATFVEIPLNNAKYLKLYIDDNGRNGNDHSVFADAKFVEEVDRNFVLDSVEDYDNVIKTRFGNPKEVTSDLELVLLQRELVKNVGQYTINSFYNESEENAATIDWLMNNQDVLRYYILGGKPEGGSYYNSLTQLARLYMAYKNDFTISEKTGYGTVYGDLYTRMAIALSLTHAQRVALWMQPSAKENQSDAVTRYQIFKDLHKNNKFRVSDTIDVTKWFENYNVEEMRFVMNNLIDDESILWLNEYVQYKIDTEPGRAWLTPHPHMAYVWPNYGNSVYYDDENYDYFNDLFSVNGKKLYDYGITRGTSDYKLYKVWMNFRNKFGTGAVCGGISKTGSNIRATHGIPATVIGQPGHAALLFYSQDEKGRGYWGIDNDVSGWTLSEKGERMLLGWGNASYSRGYSVVYMVLAQEALNDYENLEKAEEMLMLARTYNNNVTMQEELIRKAIEIQPINIDAWYDLITLYNNSTTKSEDDYYNLAEELAEDLKYFPLPMYHLTNLIQPKLTSIENSYKFTLLQARILKEASQVPNNTEDDYYVYQPSVTRTEANYLLGRIDSSIATFSFDGADAGKIVLSSRFDGNGIRFDYSLDGKNTWNEVFFTGDEPHKLQLTQKQIASITALNDIYVHIVGVNYEEKNLYKIDITEGTLLSNLYANDLENRMVGVNLNTEWRYKEQDAWTSYSVSSPDLTGNKTVQIRQAATGTQLASEASPIYTFTMDNQPDTRKYIPVSHLSIQSVSTEAKSHAGAASNSIDGNYNTRWHSAWNGTDTERFIVIKLDRSVSLSAVEFVPCGGGNGKIYDGTIYGSMDGEHWEELTSLKNLTYTNAADTVEQAIANIKSFEIVEPKEVQYVKIVADRTNGNWFTARAFNLYQDITKNPHPTAGIAYSTTESTNGKVVARLINASSKITITNNNGSDTYVFDENGTFTFEFVDEYGKEGSAVATVNWIDKDIPTADITYNLDTDRKMIISLDNISEDVYLLDKNDNKINYIEVKNGKVSSVLYLDSLNNIYKTVDVDENGCIEKITYKNTSNQVTAVETYVTIVENGVVASEEYYDVEGNLVTPTTEEKVILKGLQQPITNPLEYTFESSGDYEFKILDKASNIAYKSIKVDYINKTIIASDITYDITNLTNKSVVATINPYIFDEKGQKKDAEMITDEKYHVFEDNGEFIFKYKDSEDADNYNVKEHVAKVDWIDKKAPVALVSYKTNENGEVVATLVNESEAILLINNGGNRQYTFTKNGNFIFEFEDLAGNKGMAIATVDWIKENSSTVEITYSTNEFGEVVATLVSNGQHITITNNNGMNTYTFTKNGSFTFLYVDEEGNSKEIVATVNWITEEEPSTDPISKPEENNSETPSEGQNTNYSNNIPIYSSKNNTSNKTVFSNSNTNNTTESDDSLKEDTLGEQEEESISSKNENKTNKDEKTEENSYEEKSNQNKFKQYVLEFILIGALVTGIILVKARKSKS